MSTTKTVCMSFEEFYTIELEDPEDSPDHSIAVEAPVELLEAYVAARDEHVRLFDLLKKLYIEAFERRNLSIREDGWEARRNGESLHRVPARYAGSYDGTIWQSGWCARDRELKDAKIRQGSSEAPAK